FEHADQAEVLAGVVGRDLIAEFPDPGAQRLSVDQHLPDRPIELSLHHVRVLASRAGADVVTRTRASSTIPGTATTSSSQTTTGQSSRSARGTFASTKTSWSFPRRPIRSPGRRVLGSSPGPPV